MVKIINSLTIFLIFYLIGAMNAGGGKVPNPNQAPEPRKRVQFEDGRASGRYSPPEMNDEYSGAPAPDQDVPPEPRKPVQSKDRRTSDANSSPNMNYQKSGVPDQDQTPEPRKPVTRNDMARASGNNSPPETNDEENDADDADQDQDKNDADQDQDKNQDKNDSDDAEVRPPFHALPSAASYEEQYDTKFYFILEQLKQLGGYRRKMDIARSHRFLEEIGYFREMFLMAFIDNMIDRRGKFYSDKYNECFNDLANNGLAENSLGLDTNKPLWWMQLRRDGSLTDIFELLHLNGKNIEPIEFCSLNMLRKYLK